MPLMVDLAVARDLGVAALAGLAVGIEREWSGHASGPAERFAGARTFLLLGLIGGVTGWLTGQGLTGIALVPFAGAVLVVVAAYIVASLRPGGTVGGTTEVAALAVLLLGAVAGLGAPLLTSAATSVMVLALVEKSRIQAFVHRIGERELAAALEFAVLALVVLPFLPAGPFGPYDSIRPRALWSVVLFLSGVSFVGYGARRALGDGIGYGITGLLGGVISSTATTLSFGAESRRHEGLGPALGRGAAASAAVTVPRVALISLALDPAVARASLTYWAPSLVVGIGIVAWVFLRRTEPAPRTGSPERSPLRLGSAIQMTVVFGVVLVAVPIVQATWGSRGVLATAALIGVTDLDALTVAMIEVAATGGDPRLAAEGIAIGILASAVVKVAVAVVAGTPSFRRSAVPGLVGFVAAAGLGLWVGAN